MRYPVGHKDKTRAKILQAAGKVFRRVGYHAAGVDEVMLEAGLTAGGFYAHFAGKEALFAATLEPTASEAGLPIEKGLDGVAGRDRFRAFLERYLSPTHLNQTEDGCPIPALLSEVARASGPVKASFEAIVRDLMARLQRHAGEELPEDRAWAVLALCVGALGVARSVQDEALGERILIACRDLAMTGLDADDGPKSPVKATHKHK